MRLRILFFITLVLFFASLSSAVEQKESHHILILNSYHEGFPWTDNVVRGITEFFEKRGIVTTMHVEYMDSKVVGYSEEYKKKLFDLYKYKYAPVRHGHKPSIIISTDDNALNFLIEYHKELFPGVPIIFCGVNNFEIVELVDRESFTGILEVAGLDESLELIFKLHPETTRIVLIVDDTPSGEYRWSQMQPHFRVHPKIEFTRISSDKTIEEIEEVLGKLEVGTVVVFMTMYRDSTGRFIPLEEGVTRLSDASSQPIYTFHSQVFRYGTIGGKLLGGYHHGEEAAKIAIRVRNGEHPLDIPIVDYSMTEYTFDYEELERFGIDMSILPTGSIVTNFPISFYNEHKLMVWTVFLVMGVLVTLTSYLSINIVKRKRSEKSLEKALRDTSESEDRLQCFFDAAFEGIAISKNGKFIDGNKRFSSMFGYEYEEMLGMSIKGLVHKDDWELVLKNIESNYEEAYEHRSIHKDGSIRYLQVHGQSTQFEGCTVRITAVNDITDRKKAERELIEAYKYQTSRSRMEALGNFATGIAHDFNNALTPILGNCELLLADMQGECKPICIPRVRTIMAAAETASLLVHRMQTFTRDSDSLENIAPLRIQSCLIETFKFLRSIIPTSVVIETHIEEPLRVVRANDITLRQILMNLCKNSSQSMEDETGEISIDVCNEEIVVERFGLTKGKYISITVEDNGRGMSPEVLDKALDPYFTTKPVGEGTGIGLSVVNNIVRGYGGIVRIYSEEENGTKVVIYIPAVEDSESVKECRINVEIILGNKEQVLLVDDEPSVIGATASLVESLNYIVTPFTSGIEALAEFEMNPDKYELVITDLTMPVMTGVELINEIRKIRPEIKIILCSGLGSNGKRAADMTADPINGYLSKPVTRADYSTVLSSVLKKEG